MEELFGDKKLTTTEKVDVAVWRWTYHNHLDVEEPEGLLIQLLQDLMCFNCAHLVECRLNNVVHR
jgi:hypothetical protein